MRLRWRPSSAGSSEKLCLDNGIFHLPLHAASASLLSACGLLMCSGGFAHSLLLQSPGVAAQGQNAGRCFGVFFFMHVALHSVAIQLACLV